MALDRERQSGTIRTMESTDEFALFLWAAKGDQHAADYLQLVTDAAHVWDDVADGDVEIDRDALNSAFKALALDIPTNPFYRAYRASLDPLMQQAAVNWRAATTLERNKEAPHVAYILRSTYIDLVAHVALIVGGPDWAETICRRVRVINQTETFDDYQRALVDEASARDRAEG